MSRRALTYAGPPCRTCGGTLRYQAGTRGCVACAKAASRKHTGARLDKPVVRKRLGLA